VSNDPYFNRPEVSNSDLGELEKYWLPASVILDLESAFANGTLVDAMVTEPHKVDYFKRRVEGETYQFSPEEFENAKLMMRAFKADPFCANLLKISDFQRVTVRPDFKINYQGYEFNLPMRCKWDFFVKGFDLSADLKTTTATSQKQCEEAFYHFNYDRSRALYLDLETRSNDMVIFVSKKNHKIFKIPVTRGSERYRSGKEKYEELAFKWHYLFGDLNNVA
jgi:hypothetical protein